MGTFNHYSCVTFFSLYLYLQLLAKLEKFKTSLSSKETPTTAESKHVNDEELSDWKSVSLKFSPAAGKVSFLLPFHDMKSLHFPSTSACLTYLLSFKCIILLKSAHSCVKTR